MSAIAANLVRNLPPIEVGALTMNPDTFEVTWQGRRVDLTLSQFLAVHALARRPGHLKAWDDILDAVGNEEGSPEAARTIIKHARKALGQNARGPGMASNGPIATHYSLGWKWIVQ